MRGVTFSILSDCVKQPITQVITTTGTFAGLGALYLGTETMLRNSRDKDDIWNRLIAGALAGSLVGLRKGSLFHSAGAALSVTVVNIGLYLGNDSIGIPDGDRFFERLKSVYTK